MGKEMGTQILRGLLTTVSDATEEVGNVVKCDSKGLTFEKFLEVTEKTYTEFDDSGNPYKKTLLLPPEACVQFEADYKAWMSDPAKGLALQQVIDKLRKRFDETEARRRMVD